MSIYCEGLYVRYRHFIGKIIFVDNNYITICIREGIQKVNNVCILVFPNEWKNIQLIKESEK